MTTTQFFEAVAKLSGVIFVVSIMVGLGLTIILRPLRRWVVVVAALIALPWLLEGGSISAWSIAQSLVVLILVPLAIALAVQADWPEIAAEFQPVLAKTSTVAVIVFVVVGLGLNVDNTLDLVGTRGLLAIAGH